MKSDVPSLEACKRLAEAGLIPPAESGNIWWWVELPPDSPFLTRCPASERYLCGIYTYAPTIGEMLDYIRRWGWSVHLAGGFCFHNDGSRLSPSDDFSADISLGPMRSEHETVPLVGPGEEIGRAYSLKPADALANALHEAIEKESKNKGT